MAQKYVSLENLEYFTKLMKQYVKMQIDLQIKKETHCPNCGALITSSKCDYCGTDFEQSALWGNI